VSRALKPKVLSIAGLLRPHWMPMTLALVPSSTWRSHRWRSSRSLAEHDEKRTGDLIGRVTRW
jgi:hypothetical protein